MADVRNGRVVAVMPRQQLQARIEDLTNTQLIPISTRICTVKSEMNLFSPVSRLPRDIIFEVLWELSSIFWYDVLEEGTSDTDILYTATQYCYHFPWIAATQVCHFWREIALTEPRLWCHFKMSIHSRAELVQEVFRRSMNLPLCIVIYDSPQEGSYDSDTMQLVLQNLHRVSDLEVPNGLLRLCPEFMCRPFPNLENLLLKSHPERQYSDSYSGSPCLFKNSDFPKLQGTMICDIPLLDATALFQESLLRIGIVQSAIIPTNAFYPQLLQCLALSKNLQELIISDSTSESRDPIIWAELQQVSLPRLQEFRFCVNSPIALQILDFIRFPPGVDFYLRLCEPVWVSRTAVETFVRAVSSFLARTDRGSFREIKLLQSTESSKRNIYMEGDDDFAVETNLTGISAEHVIGRLLDSLPTSDVTNLTLYHFQCSGAIALGRALLPLKKVQSVCAYGTLGPLLVQVLAESCRWKHDVLFPELKTLCLLKVESEILPAHGTIATAFPSWLRIRSNAGFEIDDLEINGEHREWT
ncbi:hypothetical protein NLI96_g6363 [Meripilus lineatus]|uniref:F-box domain-containing protein n=1 Tax=Meripilus lineatus TaxID=2056292 RepID=A0AAD5YI70_9APHY|nr:hypothetical protein NLI96_g6363 [Physisporinus lineatus]